MARLIQELDARKTLNAEDVRSTFGPELDEAASSDHSDTRVGERVRSLRKEKGWTLVDTSARSGVARSTLSKIEGGQMSPTIGILQKIAQGLRVDITELLSDKADLRSGGRRSITRLGTGELLEHDGRVHEVLCSELSNKHMLPFRATIPARSAHIPQRWYSHDGEEFIYVVEGAVTLRSKLYEPIELYVGDCAYMDSRLAHVVVNASDTPSVVLWVVSQS